MSNIQLYPHNQETYNKIQEMWKTVNRVAAIQATGTGKSFLILKCLFDIPNKNKVVLAPTEYIFDQLVNNSKETIPNVQFITYSKLTFMTDEEIQSLNPSLIVLDEFHRCGAEQWGKGVQKLLDSFPNSKVLGTSATPIRYLDNERDMSDEIFDGNIAVNLSLAEAIVKGILPMPKYISALYTFEEEAKNLIHKVINSKNTEEEKEDLIKQIEVMKNQLSKSKGIPKILQKHLTQTNNNGKFIVFCKNKEHLNEMKDIVISWFKKGKINNKIQTYTVYTGYENTDIEFEAFRDNKDENTLKLLFSIEMLNEGIHVEDITGVILLRPTISPIIYYQQIGRAIDAGSKEEPLIFDFVNNFDNIGAKKFINDLNEYREREINKGKDNKESDKKDIFEFVIYDEVLDIKDLFNDIESKLINNWDVMYEELKNILINNNDYIIKKGSVMGNWIDTQRNYYKKNTLDSLKIEKLNNINFIWNNIEDKWNKMYIELKDFYLKYGHSNVNQDSKLGVWVANQRKNYKKGILSPEKINILNELNIIWSSKDWENTFKVLCDYYNEYGNILIPRSKIYKDINLGTWIAIQRNNYKKGTLSKDRIIRLENIKMSWDIKEELWEEIYSYLSDYKKKYGNLNVPINYKINKKNIYSWCSTQKTLFNKNKLSQYRIDKLNELNFIWGFTEDLNYSEYHLKNLLITNKVTSKMLSKILNISASSVDSWRCNISNIPNKHIQKIADYFSIETHLIQPQKGDGCIKSKLIK